MILRTSKKVIFTTLIFFNFIQPLNSADYQKINKSKKNFFTKLSSLKISNNTELTNWSNSSSKLKFETNYVDKKFLNRYSEPLLADLSKKQQEIII